jgi:hypothetical protein
MLSCTIQDNMDFTAFVDFDEEAGDWEMEIAKLDSSLEGEGVVLTEKHKKEEKQKEKKEEKLGMIFNRFDQVEELWKDRLKLKMNAQSAKKNRETAMEIKKTELFPFILVMFPEVSTTSLVAIVVGYIGLESAFELLREVDKLQSSPSPTLSEYRIMIMGEFGTLLELVQHASYVSVLFV